MAIPTPVNGQITDAITQSNITTIGSTPGLASGLLAQAAAQATALSMQNAVANQQAMNELGIAVVARSVAMLGGDKS